MIIVFHKNFEKDFKKLPSKLKEKFNERFIIFGKDEFNPVLNNHPLKGKYLGHRSINIIGDSRAIYKQGGDEATFIEIDSHSNLYS